MAIVIVDGQEITLGDKERLNGIQAAARAGVSIPYYCWHPGLSVVASCRMCLVETGSRDPNTGAITMVPKLVPACQTPAKDGTVFVTNSDKVRQSRAQVEEALLIDHPIDCPICDKAGECLLQDYHFEHGQSERRADIRPFTSRRREMGDTVTLFVDRCVMCSRCVRFTREISGTKELMVVNRGSQEEIDVFPGYPLANKLSGNVVDLCPVGALGDKDFLYQQRVWFMKRHAGVCTRCSTGCSIYVEENQDTIYRLKPRENQHVNQWWICDEGRYDYHHVHDVRRLTGPHRRDTTGGELVATEWSRLVIDLPQRFRAAQRVGAVFSPFLSVEEAYLLATWIRSLDPQAILAMGPVPVEGQDERFPQGFVIHAEKCPNRRGVEEVLRHFTGHVVTFESFVDRVEAGELQAAWISGGYRQPWIDNDTAARLSGLALLVVQDLFPSPLTNHAQYVLPSASYAERDGSYVNYQDRLQTAVWAVRAPAGVWSEAWLFWRLHGKQGLYNARLALDQAAAAVPFFAAAADRVPETGVQLKAVELVPT
ncbi:MAG: (2Fe-2S)-binding protein [Planctomycetes bacterium]|nr:(2Fe-2S)-binding protein [Planctomycetota bacterium]